MKTFSSPQVAASSSTIRRTLLLWLISNLGGTSWLLLDFAKERLADYSIALFIGLLAALISLFIVPLVIPFFAVMCRCCSGWMRRSMACLGVVLFYVLANLILLLGLPIDSFSSLLGMSVPYLSVALLTVFWLYGPGQHVAKSVPTQSQTAPERSLPIRLYISGYAASSPAIRV